jgi:hypothetical protein
MIVRNRFFGDFKRDDPAQGHDPKKTETSFPDADRAQTYNVQQQFGRWA